jgi:hypothetical protein
MPDAAPSSVLPFGLKLWQLVVIVAVVGFVAYYAYEKYEASKSATTAASTSTDDSNTGEADETAAYDTLAATLNADTAAQDKQNAAQSKENAVLRSTEVGEEKQIKADSHKDTVASTKTNTGTAHNAATTAKSSVAHTEAAHPVRAVHAPSTEATGRHAGSTQPHVAARR